MEVDTAVQHDAKIVVIISNNAAWNIERFDQEANYSGRVIGTTLRHSDNASMSIALGAHGERVENVEDLQPAIARAIENAGLWLILSPLSKLSPLMPRKVLFSFQTLKLWRLGMTRNELAGNNPT